MIEKKIVFNTLVEKVLCDLWCQNMDYKNKETEEAYCDCWKRTARVWKKRKM